MQALLGVIVFIGLAWIFSEQKGRFPLKLVSLCLVAQCLFALVFQIDFVNSLLISINAVVMTVTDATKAGTSFVFGYIGGGASPFVVDQPQNMMVIAFQILPIIVVMSAISSLLYHFGILQRLIGALAWVLRKFTGVDGPTGLGVASSVFLGIIESPLFIKPYLKTMSRSSLFTLLTAGMSTVAGTVIVLYATFLSPIVDNALAQLIIASVISAPAAILIAQIMVPQPVSMSQSNETSQHNLEKRDEGAIEAIIRGTQEGIEMCLQITGILIVLFAFISLANGFLGSVFHKGITLQSLASYPYYPLCWLMGITTENLSAASELMSTKTILNEFVAYSQMSTMTELSEKSRIILSYALCGFANFGSLGILVGGLSSLLPERRKEIVELSMKSVIAGTLATMMTGALAGLLMI